MFHLLQLNKRPPIDHIHKKVTSNSVSSDLKNQCQFNIFQNLVTCEANLTTLLEYFALCLVIFINLSTPPASIKDLKIIFQYQYLQYIAQRGVYVFQVL